PSELLVQLLDHHFLLALLHSVSPPIEPAVRRLACCPEPEWQEREGRLAAPVLCEAGPRVPGLCVQSPALPSSRQGRRSGRRPPPFRRGLHPSLRSWTRGFAGG